MSGGELTPTEARNRVGHLATTDWPEALRLARSIRDPWFRCQALSTVAERCPQPEACRSLLSEAFHAAAAAGEPNRIVSVSGWPLEVLAQIDADAARTELERLARSIQPEPHPVRRLDALFLVAWLLRDAPAGVFLAAADHFLAFARMGHGWKRDRDLKDMAVLLARKGERARSEALLSLIEKPRIRRQALREIEGG